VRAERAVEESAVFGQGFRSSASAAAFANGVSGHALDFDFSFAIGGQPMAGIAAAVFALAEQSHASGARLLESYVVGFEVAGKLMRSMPSHTDVGWHSTGTVGTLGCTAAACHLLDLSVEQTTLALGMAASMAGGVSWNFGTMSKPLHAGQAARNGVLAAQLASRGYSANPRLLEGPRGYFETFAGEGKFDLAPLESLGTSYEIDGGIRYKAYPCGGLTHTAIDAMLALRREEGVTATDVDQVRVGVTAGTASHIIYRIPENGLQGKFSMPYILARTLLDGRLVPDTFSDEAVREPAVLALVERIHMEVDPELSDQVTINRPSRVHIQLKDGRSLSRQVEHAKGSPPSPLTDEELREKFTICASRVLDEASISRAIGLLEGIEKLDDAAALGELLLGSPTPAR
jgi:2-methylcitrate dehydratase PrpD